MKVVDVHTHMLNEAWLRLLKKHGGRYKVKKVKGGQTGIHHNGAPFARTATMPRRLSTRRFRWTRRRPA